MTQPRQTVPARTVCRHRDGSPATGPGPQRRADEGPDPRRGARATSRPAASTAPGSTPSRPGPTPTSGCSTTTSAPRTACSGPSCATGSRSRRRPAPPATARAPVGSPNLQDRMADSRDYVRLLMWEALERSDRATIENEDLRREVFDEWAAAIEAAQREGTIPDDLDARQLVLSELAMAIFPFAFPQLTRLVTNRSPADPEFQAERRTFLERLGAHLTRPRRVRSRSHGRRWRGTGESRTGEPRACGSGKGHHRGAHDLGAHRAPRRARPGPHDAHRRARPDPDLRGVPRPGRAGGRRPAGDGGARGHAVLVAAPDPHRHGRPVGGALPARRAPEPDHPPLPRPRGRLRPPPDRRGVLRDPGRVPRLRLPRAGRTGDRGPRPRRHASSSSTTGSPRATPRRCRRPRPGSPPPRRRSAGSTTRPGARPTPRACATPTRR